MNIYSLNQQFNYHMAVAGEYIGMLSLRLFLAWEFLDSGLQKFNGENWFEQRIDDFPFPFNALPSDISWFIATLSELLGPILLVIGLGTRYVSTVLIILTLVAWYTIHTDSEYSYLLVTVFILIAGGAYMLLSGFQTRYLIIFASLMIIPFGWFLYNSAADYNVCANGYKIPLIYLVTFIPLLTIGPGRLSLDHWLSQRR